MIGRATCSVSGWAGWIIATARASRPPPSIALTSQLPMRECGRPTVRFRSKGGPVGCNKSRSTTTHAQPRCLLAWLLPWAPLAKHTHSHLPPQCMHLTLQEERHKTSRNCHFTNTTVPVDSYDHEDEISAKSAASGIMCLIVRHGRSAFSKKLSHFTGLLPLERPRVARASIDD